MSIISFGGTKMYETKEGWILECGGSKHVAPKGFQWLLENVGTPNLKYYIATLDCKQKTHILKDDLHKYIHEPKT